MGGQGGQMAGGEMHFGEAARFLAVPRGHGSGVSRDEQGHGVAIFVRH